MFTWKTWLKPRRVSNRMNGDHTIAHYYRIIIIVWIEFCNRKKIKNTHFHSTFIDLFPRFPGNIYKTVCSTEFQMNTDFIFTKYPFYLPMSTELSFELNGIEQISSTKCNDFNFYKWNWFFPFSFAFFSHRARTHTHNHFSRNEEIRCELKGERVETSKIGFLCYLKNVQLPFIYFALFAGCYLSVWIFFFYWDVSWIEIHFIVEEHHQPSEARKKNS